MSGAGYSAEVLKVLVKRTQYGKYILAVSVAVITFIVYLSCLRNDFINWDDDVYVLDNVHIRSLDPAFFKWIFFHFYAAYWAPLTWVSHAVDYAFWGLNPWGHHLTNNILHAANSFFVVLLVAKLIEGWKRTESKKGPTDFFSDRMILVASGGAGLLFGLHPLHVESAAWVAERKDLLCALFFLISIMTYTAYVDRATDAADEDRSFSRFRDKYYLLTAGSFILALFSKPMAVSLPLVLLILDWYPFNRIRSRRTLLSALYEKLPLVALSLASSTVIFLAHRAQAAMATVDEIPPSTRLIVAANSLITYLGKMIWPAGLIPYYPYPADVSLLSPKYLSATALVIGITIICFFLAKKRRLWLAAWGYYVVTLIPVLGIVQVGPQSMADRFTYLPSLGPFLIVGTTAASILKKANEAGRRRPIIKALCILSALLVCLALSALTYRQIGIWKNGITLWSAVIEKEPVRAYVAYNNRGVCYEKAGRFDKAIEDYNRTIALHPSDDQAYFNLGVLYYKAGEVDAAIAYYGRSLAINPQRAEAYHNRGVAYSNSGFLDKALEDFNQAIALNPDLDIAYLNRGGLYQRTGKKELALKDFQRACEGGNPDACKALETIR